MKQHHKLFLALLLVGLFLTHCKTNDNKISSDKWYEDTKTEILKQASLHPDSTNLTYNEDSTFKEEHYFSGGHEYLLKGYSKDMLRVQTHYSKDGNFELRREICENGNVLFEGIVYQDHFYGLSTWRYCDGQIDQQGVRHHDNKIGIWRKFDETGNLTEETDYKNMELLDAMPTISK